MGAAQDDAEPPRAVLDAFGLTGTPTRLAGGRGTTWRVGAATLKPLDMAPAALAWQADLLGRLDDRADFRVSPPLRTSDGALTSRGWTAWRYEPGRHLPRRWPEIVETGRLLHAAVAAEPEPAFLRERADRWAVGDRVAWGELPVDRFAGTKHLDALSAARRPVDANRQLIHGDLTGNVLFHAELPPLIIDLSPYWRAPGFADAVVIADALVWEGGTDRDVGPLLAEPDFAQYLLRALIYRAVSDHCARRAQPGLRRADKSDLYLPAVELAIRLSAG